MDLDRLNRRTYASRASRRQYGRASGWLDRGEQVAIAHVTEQAERGTILDIGVGGGRTTPLLSPLATRYCGIDYTADLLAVAQSRFPNEDLREMDARALAFQDASFNLVVFSFNGLDSVDLAGRLAILREVYRVLSFGGAFIFSALNRNGPGFGESLWKGDVGWHGPMGTFRRLRRMVKGSWRQFSYRPMIIDGEHSALAPLSAHDFGVMAMFTTLREQCRQLEAGSFMIEAIFDDVQGFKVDPMAEPACSESYYYVARKPASAAPPAEPQHQIAPAA